MSNGSLKKALKSFVVECCLEPVKLMGAVTGKSEFVKTLRTGSHIILNPSQKIQFIQWVRPVYEPHIYRLGKRVLVQGDLAIDVGAHVGYWTLVFSDLVGSGGYIVSVEPENANYDRLLRNLKLNGKTGFTLAVNAALSDTDGRGTLSICEDNEGGHHVAASGSSKKQDIQLQTLDSLLAGAGPLPRCKLLKMDVEGHEVVALGGMRRLLASAERPMHMIIEASKRNLVNRESVFRTMTGYGYECRNIFDPDQFAGVMDGGMDMYFRCPF